MPPRGQYAITGSGILGIRDLREIADIDIIVTNELWEILAEKYDVVDESGVRRIVFPGGNVEAFSEDSFYSGMKDSNALLVADRIARADVIEGLPFESFEDVLYYKRKMGREKDLTDIFLIETLINEKKSIRDFKRIPGVGSAITEDLWQLGYKEVEDLRDLDPDVLFEDLCTLQGCRVDRCMLYMFRCAVYFASNSTHDPCLLKWWNWKN